MAVERHTCDAYLGVSFLNTLSFSLSPPYQLPPPPPPPLLSFFHGDNLVAIVPIILIQKMK
jgi:hypothetical protein